MSDIQQPAANELFKLPPQMFDARCRACWFTLALVLLSVASFWSLDLQWAKFLSPDAFGRMAKFIGELLVPETSGKFVTKLLGAAWETLCMSALGTAIAAVLGLALALPASKTFENDPARSRWFTRLVLGLHTAGVLGRLFSESIENVEAGPGFALRVRGASEAKVFWFSTLPLVIPQLLSYTLYRWENNIRAAAVLGVVGAGGLGQMLAFHMGLFQMGETSSVLIAMMALVAIVDIISFASRRWMTAP
jgi:phosphonate transport system permease protein